MGFYRSEPYGVCRTRQCTDAGVQHGAACMLGVPGRTVGSMYTMVRVPPYLPG